MDCKQVEPLLDLLDGEDLSTEEAQAVRAHLQECSACRLQLERVRSSVELLAALGPESMAEELPDTAHEGWWADMRDTVAERIAVSTPTAVHRPWRGPLWFGTGFAAAAGLLIALWLGLGQPASPLDAVVPGPGGGIAKGGEPLEPVKGPLDPSLGGAVPVIHLPAGIDRRGWPFNRTRRQNPQEGGADVRLVDDRGNILDF